MNSGRGVYAPKIVCFVFLHGSPQKGQQTCTLFSIIPDHMPSRHASMLIPCPVNVGVFEGEFLGSGSPHYYSFAKKRVSKNKVNKHTHTMTKCISQFLLHVPHGRVQLPMPFFTESLKIDLEKIKDFVPIDLSGIRALCSTFTEFRLGPQIFPLTRPRPVHSSKMLSLQQSFNLMRTRIYFSYLNCLDQSKTEI